MMIRSRCNHESFQRMNNNVNDDPPNLTATDTSSEEDSEEDSAKDTVLDSTTYLAEIFRHLTPPDFKNAVLVRRSIRIIIKVVFIFRCI